MRLSPGRHAPQVLGLERTRPTRRRHEYRSQHADHDQRRRRRWDAGARKRPLVRVPAGRHAPQVLGLQQRRPARRRHDDQSQHPDHDQPRRRRRDTGPRRRPHVRNGRQAPQVLGLQCSRPARRRHDDQSQHPDHDQCRRRRWDAGARLGPHVRVPAGRHAPQVLGLQQRRPARRRHDDQSQHPDHDHLGWRRRGAGCRQGPHVRVPHGRHAPQVLGWERRRPARRQHDDQSQHPDHDQRRRAVVS